ncbi:MAG TPA: hypothetical protein VLJ62_30230, partial [Burkholderiaceae bacterium]|nr:hypothetical protein [Burkholderiaceae bacterium]
MNGTTRRIGLLGKTSCALAGRTATPAIVATQTAAKRVIQRAGRLIAIISVSSSACWSFDAAAKGGGHASLSSRLAFSFRISGLTLSLKPAS